MKPLSSERIFAFIVAFALAIGSLVAGTGVANAADTYPWNEPVTLQGKAGDITLKNTVVGHTYTLYKLGDYTSASFDSSVQGAKQFSAVSSGVTIAATSPSANAVVAAAASAGAAKNGWTQAQQFTSGDAVSWAAGLPTNSAQLRQLVASLQQQDLTALGDPADQVSATSTQETLTAPSAGWYLITDSYTNAAGKQAYGVGALVGTQFNINVHTNSMSTRMYTIVSLEDSTDASSALQPLGIADMKPDTDGGDENPIKTVEGAVVDGATDIFMLQATIPDYSKFDHDTLEYKFIDHPSSKLTIDTDSITVSVGDAATAIAKDPDTYSVETAANGDIVIDFSNYLRNAANVSDLAGKVLKVSYAATVGTLAEDGNDADAINSFDIDNNGVTVPEGPNDPNPNNPGNDTSIAPDASLKFKKTDAAGNPLQYAQFTLSMADDPATPIDESLVKVVATSGADGIVEFTNLGADTTSDTSKLPLTSTYTITETHAPKKSDGDSITADYVDLGGEVLSGQVSITKLGTATDPGTATVTLKEQQDDNGLIDGEGDNLTVKNVASLLQLPLTGRVGMVLVGAVVLVLAAGAAALALVSRRNKKLSIA
jgi:hypothetical protein